MLRIIFLANTNLERRLQDPGIDVQFEGDRSKTALVRHAIPKSLYNTADPPIS